MTALAHTTTMHTSAARACPSRAASEMRRRNDAAITLLRRARSTSLHERRRLEQQVMLEYRGLADALANRFRSAGVDLLDLRQVAYVGLAKAVRSFDTAHGTEIASFAVPTITGELKRYLRDTSWFVRPPRALQEFSAQLAAELPALEQQLRRPPTVADIAYFTGETRATVIEALACAHARRAYSLDAPAPGVEGGTDLADVLPCSDTSIDDLDLSLTLEFALGQLTPDVRDMLRLRYFESLTQREIASRLGVSQMQVSRQLRLALQTLRSLLDPAYM